jgi:hypothetical protein
MIDKPDLHTIANEIEEIIDIVNENETAFDDTVRPIDGPDLDESEKTEPEPNAPSPLNGETLVTQHPLLLLGSLECKWPIGDPRSSEFRFCRDPRFTAKARHGMKLLPYCEHHVRVSRGPATEDPSQC